MKQCFAEKSRNRKRGAIPALLHTANKRMNNKRLVINFDVCNYRFCTTFS